LTKFDPYEWSELTMNNPRRIQRHLVKALAAGALLAAAALPLAVASTAYAAGGSVTSVSFSPHGATTNSFGTGASGTVAIAGTGFAADGGNVTVTSNAPGLTFSGAAETTSSAASASFASTSATVPGSYSITVTDDNGTETLASAFTVDAAPTVTSATPASLSDGNPLTSVTIAGAGFVTGATVTLTSDVNGTTLTVGSTTVAVGGASLTVNVTPTNSVTDNPATAGTYDITVTNPDGGNSTLSAGFTITAFGITTLSPSAVPVPTSGSSTTNVTITGAGFEFGATVTLGCSGSESAGSATVSSATSLTVPITVATGTTPEQCDVTVTNPTVGGNGATSFAAGAFGVGMAGDLAPIVTASSLTTAPALNAGDPATTVTFTGSGFSQYTVGGNTYDSTGATDSSATVSDCSGNSGTSLTCQVTVFADATAGSHTAALFNDGAEGDFANAFSVAGPAITSAAPPALAVGAPVGTVVVLTGTGFTNTTQGEVDSAGTLNGVFQFVNATTEDFVVTSSPNSTDVTGHDVIFLFSVDSNGDYVFTPAFPLTIDAAPTISSLAYPTGTTGVGVGATAQTIKITGTGFQTGATVGSFKNGNGVADPSVVATVTSVNLSGTVITATVAIAAGDANPADGYTVTNPDGGSASVLAIQTDALVIDPGPTATAVSPATGLASATTAFTITGTGFEAGAVVAASSDGTCAPATVVSATSITVSCTLGAAPTTGTGVSLIITNPDGGSATSAVVLAVATATPPPVAKPFHLSRVVGHAVVGRTVSVTIIGTGFHGQPHITSSAPGTKAIVSHDNGTKLVVRVTTRATTKPGVKLFTVGQGANHGKVHYTLVK
jgi:hypothetical protein